MTEIAERLQQVIDRAIAERRIVGTVVLVGRTGAPDLRLAAGFLDREAGTRNAARRHLPARVLHQADRRGDGACPHRARELSASTTS